MSADVMLFPDTWEEFKNTYGFVDEEEVYTNKVMLIPVFRVDQWIEHMQHTGHWIHAERFWQCSVCNEYSSWTYKYCPHCGAQMDVPTQMSER